MPSDALDRLRSALRPYAKAKVWNKCFCIGAHKTGTTTMNQLMGLLGYDCAPQAEVEMATTHQVQLGIYRELKEIVSRYDFFQDSPFAYGVVFVALDALFPDSKFIFTYRDPEEWWRSNVNFTAKCLGIRPDELSHETVSSICSKNIGKNYLRMGYGKDNRDYWRTACVSDLELAVYDDPSLSYDKNHNIGLYLSRRDSVLKYFSKRPSDLLVLDLSKEAGISRVVRFLGMPEWVDFTMPRFNSTDSDRDSASIQILDPMLKRVLFA